MSIKYKMIYRGDYLNPEGKKKTGYYPQVVRRETIKTAKLASKMTIGRKHMQFEAENHIRTIFHCIEEELKNGNHVCIEDFGTFSLTAESRDVTHPSQVRAESIFVKHIVFKPSKSMKLRMRGADFERENENV